MTRTRMTATMLILIPLAAFAPAPAQAEVTDVAGGAYGFSTFFRISGGTSMSHGHGVSVSLQRGGSAEPITGTVASAEAEHDGIVMFSSGRITASTRGVPGPDGFVRSWVAVEDVNTSGQEVFSADEVVARCSADGSGATASATIRGGTLQVSEGGPEQGDETVVAVPTDPAPNTRISGVIESTGDSFVVVLNEPLRRRDGAASVAAVHLYWDGDRVQGDSLIGLAACTTTDARSPRVVGTSPGSGARGVSPAADVGVVFNDDLQPESVDRRTILLFRKGSTTPVAASVRYDAGTRTAVLDPTRRLRRGATYRVRISTRVTDQAGNRLDQRPAVAGLQPKVWLFTVSRC